MKIGLIGGGNISNTHAKAGCAIAGVEIVAGYGRNSGTVNQLSRDHGAVPYSDFAAFLAHPMDMVIVGGPSGLHASQGIAAALVTLAESITARKSSELMNIHAAILTSSLINFLLTLYS